MTLTCPRKLQTKVWTGSCWIQPPARWRIEASRRVTRPLPRGDYVSLTAWKRVLHYMVQSKTHEMYGIQITTINNHKAKILMHNVTHKICPLRKHRVCRYVQYSKQPHCNRTQYTLSVSSCYFCNSILNCQNKKKTYLPKRGYTL